ncbi:hypothetical protein T01_3589 [Trichinella spiralis]|uniref:Uncharacterized protein n=1 Tax=Trichinella spiralis TaxID=6334 RepID=A0A0V1AW59_TRISP|nr:hypothetical protein T01_3589 [Trichinella spiralis]
MLQKNCEKLTVKNRFCKTLEIPLSDVIVKTIVMKVKSYRLSMRLIPNINKEFICQKFHFIWKENRFKLRHLSCPFERFFSFVNCQIQACLDKHKKN